MPRVSSEDISCCWEPIYFHFSADLGHGFVSKGEKLLSKGGKAIREKPFVLMAKYQVKPWFFFLWENCFSRTGKRIEKKMCLNRINLNKNLYRRKMLRELLKDRKAHNGLI